MKGKVSLEEMGGVIEQRGYSSEVMHFTSARKFHAYIGELARQSLSGKIDGFMALPIRHTPDICYVFYTKPKK